jgi:hypothetical protein
MQRLPLPKKYSWYSFLLEAESTPGPWCSQKYFVRKKFQSHHWDLTACSAVPQPIALPHTLLNVRGWRNPLLLPFLNSLLWIQTEHKTKVTGYWGYSIPEFLLSHLTKPKEWPPTLLLNFWCILIQMSPYIGIKHIFRSAGSSSLDWLPLACGVAPELSRPHPTWCLLVRALEGHGVPGENTKHWPPKRMHYRCMCCIKPDVLKWVCHEWERHILMCY